jgi:hypothetical protein
VDESIFVVITFGLLVVAGLVIMWMAMQSRRHVREMEHRERLAMIERGLLPSPELDPAAFEQHLGRPPQRETATAVRWRTSGTMLMGLGLALLFLLTFTAGEAAAGLGIGGALIVLGAAFFVNSMMMGRESSRPAPLPPLPRSEPKDTPPLG